MDGRPVPRPEDPVDEVEPAALEAWLWRRTSQPTMAIVAWSAWSAANSIPGHGVQATPRPEGVVSGFPACRRRAASSACFSARRVARTFQRSTAMWVSATTSR